MLRNPRGSARRQAHALRLKEFSVRPILHMHLHYHPYKNQVSHEPSERDILSRLQFFHEFLDLLKNNSDLVNTLLSDEAHFQVSENVNKQNYCY